jgi:hypothetical protein
MIDHQKVIDTWQQGHTYRDAGKILGITGERVRQIVRLNHELTCSSKWVGPNRGTDHCPCVQKHMEGRRRQQERALNNPQIRADYEAGMKVDEIATKHGVHHATLWKTVQTYPERSKAIRKTHMWKGNRDRRTSKDVLIGHIKSAADHLGHTPTRAEYDAMAKSMGWPSSQTVCIRFDHWSTALGAAGLTPSPRSAKVSRSRSDKHWTQEKINDALHYMYEERGEFPVIARYRELARETPWLPSDQIVRRSTSWPEARMAIIESHANWRPTYSQMELIDPHNRKGRPRKNVPQVAPTPPANNGGNYVNPFQPAQS